jgi:hypothetical protein
MIFLLGLMKIILINNYTFNISDKLIVNVLIYLLEQF